MIKNKFLHSSIFNSWFSNLVILFSSLIAIPIVITKLKVEEINLWFLFASVVALSQGVLFGFNGTFARFIAYSFGGVRICEFKNLRYKKILNFNDNIDINEFSKIFFLMRKVYRFLSFIYLIILLLIGLFVLNKPIQSLEYQGDGWTAWAIVVVSTTLTLTFGYYQVFLEGINKVALFQRILGIVNLAGLFFILLVLFACPKLISIVFVYQLVAVSATFTIVYFAKKELNTLKVDKDFDIFDKELFLVVWNSAWKSGITTIIANIVKHISVILVSQLFNAAQSASFLFTKRIFDIIERFTMTTFQARIPTIAKLRGRGDFQALLPYLKQTQYISYGVFLVSYIVFITMGENILHLIKSNVHIGNFDLIILFSFATFLSRWTGITAMIANLSNHVVDYINLIIASIIYLLVIYIFYNNIGINIFPLAMFLGYFFSSPSLIFTVYKTLHTSFINYEKKVMFPMLGILIIINLIYYWSNI